MIRLHPHFLEIQDPLQTVFDQSNRMLKALHLLNRNKKHLTS